MGYRLRAFSKEDQEIIFNWRNLQHIRMNMYDDQLIPYEEHCRWFEYVLKEQIHYYRLFLYHDKPLGLISFKNYSLEKQSCDWGFYIGESHAPKGAGTIMGYLGLEYAFHHLGMKKIFGEVLSFNDKSKSFHRKLGFKHEGLSKNKLIRDGRSIEVNNFSILKEGWDKHKGTLKSEFYSRGVIV
ncbi:UDP-4-amino-4,6-dideoxy-N-acetyl-beta-L-altrosamine N-acetyltransferase [Peribacillus sp. NPDC097264]|uniref:UDP-4-amino-4, 6-dideoxy-N-acetyl-beta-L-altrosamine N-acetyltransferase n=1 Tax=Peribacillus sp. NPDC097264 TaxID=3390616 RepID=UPI003D02E43A